MRFIAFPDGDYVLADEDALPSAENAVEFGSSSLDISFNEDGADYAYAGDN